MQLDSTTRCSLPLWPHAEPQQLVAIRYAVIAVVVAAFVTVVCTDDRAHWSSSYDAHRNNKVWRKVNIFRYCIERCHKSIADYACACVVSRPRGRAKLYTRTSAGARAVYRNAGMQQRIGTVTACSHTHHDTTQLANISAWAPTRSLQACAVPVCRRVALGPSRQHVSALRSVYQNVKV